jgi:hypothetical protein
MKGTVLLLLLEFFVRNSLPILCLTPSLVFIFALALPSFPNMSEIEKFKYILSSNDLDICKICILGLKKMYDLNQSL